MALRVMMTFAIGKLKRKADSTSASFMKSFNQRGLTLIEVLVSILIISGGCVYVLQALAQSARVQQLVEERISFYPFLASKLAKIEMRVSSEKDPFKSEKGSYEEKNRRYAWSISSPFYNPLEAKLPRESLGTSVLLSRSVKLGLSDRKSGESLQFVTLTKAPIPENQK